MTFLIELDRSQKVRDGRDNWNKLVLWHNWSVFFFLPPRLGGKCNLGFVLFPEAAARSIPSNISVVSQSHPCYTVLSVTVFHGHWNSLYMAPSQVAGSCLRKSCRLSVGCLHSAQELGSVAFSQHCASAGIFILTRCIVVVLVRQSWLGSIGHWIAVLRLVGRSPRRGSLHSILHQSWPVECCLRFLKVNHEV